MVEWDCVKGVAFPASLGILVFRVLRELCEGINGERMEKKENEEKTK